MEGTGTDAKGSGAARRQDFFPLVQDMPAAGVSPGELKEQIEKKLKEYLSAPNVTVIVESIQSYKVYVVGKVQKPGGIMTERP